MLVDILDSFDTVYIKYGLLILCLIYILVMAPNNIEKLFLSLAEVFTICADYFLLVKCDNFEIGVFIFIFAQLFHYVRILIVDRKINKCTIIGRGLLISICFITTYFLIKPYSLLVGLICIYFPLLVMNSIDSFLLFKLKKMNILLFMGFILFICCDISVGMYNIDCVIDEDIPRVVLNIFYILMWGFYLPSQVLISLSWRDLNYEK